MLFCIILHMKLFTKETLTHTSLYQLKVTHRDRGKLEGRGGRGDFFFVCLFVSSWMCFTNQILQGRQKPDRQTEKERERKSREAGQAAGKHTEQETLASSPTSARAENIAQPSPGHRHYTRRCWNWSNTLILFKFASFFSFLFLSQKKKDRLKYKNK